MKTMTMEEMEQIFMIEIHLEGLEINSGIWEFHEEGNKSIGVSYENIEGNLVYIFNLFVDGEYVNVCGEYDSIYDAVEEVVKAWNKYA